MPTARESVLEINLDALAHNYNYLRSKTSEQTKFMAVVKASAYGSEVVHVAKKLIRLGTDYLAVAYTSEGIELRKAGITAPILVFHPQAIHFKSLVEHSLEPSLYSEKVLEEFISTAEGLNQKDYPVHIKFNTGLNRLGFPEEKAEEIFEELKSTNSVKVVSIFSHLAASADWREREFTLQQIYSFKRIGVKVYKILDYLPLMHICNTSGIINYPEAAFDMVRAGIGLYGFGNDENENRKLMPVGTLKTIISQIQKLEKGDTVGYNRAFKAEKDTKIAVLPLGYADGIGREYGKGKGSVRVKNKIAPIIGNICMDMIMIDITNIDCCEGDEVLIFGDLQNTTEFAEAGNTISYELITRIAPRVKRVLLEK